MIKRLWLSGAAGALILCSTPVLAGAAGDSPPAAEKNPCIDACAAKMKASREACDKKADDQKVSCRKKVELEAAMCGDKCTGKGRGKKK